MLSAWTPLQWGADDLLPEELPHIVNAVEHRQREFATGRVLARRLLEDLGIRRGPLRVGPDRVPVWPDSVVGSISHAGGYCAVVVAKRPPVHGLGVDIEPALPLEPELWPYISTKRELAWITARANPGVLVRLIFSAKESAYKCFYPLLRQFWTFQDVEIELEFTEGQFEATLPGPQSSLSVHAGAFRITSGFIVTGMLLGEDGQAGSCGEG